MRVLASLSVAVVATVFLALTGCAATGAGAREVFVVRHAEAWKNVTPPPDLPPDETDSLTPRGERQADDLGRWLDGRDVAAVLCSPTDRTRETAERIAVAIGAPVVVSRALVSLHAGFTPAGDPVTWEWRLARWQEGEDPRPAGGESLADGVRRALAAIDDTRGNVVVVTHGDLVAGLVGHAAGTAYPDRWSRHEIAAGGAAEITVRAGGEWIVREVRPPVE